jgi:hypothetical protein
MCFFAELVSFCRGSFHGDAAGFLSSGKLSLVTNYFQEEYDEEEPGMPCLIWRHDGEFYIRSAKQ